MDPSAQRIVELLGLERHPEGGWFRETHRRAESTAIYYLLTEASPSHLHRVDADEVFHHYAGDAVEQVVIAGTAAEVRWLGPDIHAGQRPQAVVPADAWQGCRVVAPDGWALLGCTVAPAFEFEGFELAGPADVDALVAAHPDQADLLRALA